ncbi:MAG: M36 family metallopeptidase [Pyrinomonadaceae bacterium]
MEVISVKNVARYAVGRGMVFKPNPIISSGLTTFKDNNDANSIALNKQRVSVVLQDLDNSGTLSGTYATTKPTRTFKRALSKTRVFNFLRSDDRFEEVMTYHYVTEPSRYVAQLGFDMKSIFNGRALPIDVNFANIENAFFDPIEKQLAFGSGSVDTAEDATVIVHEFGHALLDHQAPNFDTGNGYTEGGAIHEGFGDYLAGSFFAGSGFNKGEWSSFLGSWFAAGIPQLNVGVIPPHLRSMNNTKHYPEALDEMGEPHNNGEIWSATLWDIFKKVGKKPADTLIIESNFRLNGAATFADAANNILAVDKELYAGRNQTVLRGVFVKRGILK